MSKVSVIRFRQVCMLLLAATMLASGHAYAQTPTPPVAEEKVIDFSVGGQIDYDIEKEIVTATGDVRATREGNKVRADRITWNRNTGEVRAEGNVVVESKDGDIAYGDSVELKDTLKDGVVENLLLVLADGGRLAAKRGIRVNGVTTLERAAYSPCRVTDDAGCPKEPVWKVTAARVVHNPEKNRISYDNARLELLGLPILALPGLSHPADERGGTGLLVPDIQYSSANGLELSAPFYVLIDRNRDLTITPHIYSDVLPALEMKYRALSGKGAYQIGGIATYSSRIPVGTVGAVSQNDFRGYLEGSGRWQLDPRWSISASARLVTDRTFLRRYGISRDDRLRSLFDIERVTRTSYFSLAGWAFQTLRVGDAQGQMPIALPMVDYRKRLTDPLLGGRIELQLNSIALARTEGQDTQRAFVGARWDLRKLSNWGQEFQLTAYARGDAYRTDEITFTPTLPYRGTDGFNGRFVSAFAAEMRWPFVGPLFGGTQRITPRFQLVASPGTANMRIPNEDARAVDLEDSNLFALNRFPGYDRWEDGSRITYGLDWNWSAPNISIQANVGQSYRLTTKPTLFPDGTGLFSRTSDVVGRTTVKYKKYLSFSHRYRLDKDSLAIRRNEIDATIGSDKTYAVVGYLRLNRDIGPQLEDLRDREEIRLGGRVQFAKYWSLFGSTIIDLTSQREDPLTTADGYEPVRHRLGIAYEDDCLNFGVTWRRDYDASGDARRGNTFQLRLSFKNLGR